MHISAPYGLAKGKTTYRVVWRGIYFYNGYFSYYKATRWSDGPVFTVN